MARSAGGTLSGSGRTSIKMLVIISRRSLPRCGGCPLRISCRMPPKRYTSVFSPMRETSPPSISGAMYAGVPAISFASRACGTMCWSSRVVTAMPQSAT
jgi:hypothetical protein